MEFISKQPDIKSSSVRAIHGLNAALSATVAWAVLGMALISLAIVILRKFGLGWVAMQETVVYLHATVFMLGAAHALRQERHARVDVFYAHFTARGKAWVDLFGALFLLMPMCGLLAWVSWDYVMVSWQLGERSQETGGIPAVFLLKSLIPLMAILLMLQGVAQAVACIGALRRQ